MVTLLQLLQLLTSAAYSGNHLADSRHAPLPAAQMELTYKTERAVGECGILLSSTAPDRSTEQNRQRQVCFALQSYGFLTRYAWHDPDKPSPWGQDVCLLLAFCGSNCHRLYGHPQQTPAARNALSEAAAFAMGRIGGAQPHAEAEWTSSENKSVALVHHAAAEPEEHSAKPDSQHPKPSEAGWSTVPPVKALSQPAVHTPAQAATRGMEHRSDKCRRHFMSRAAPGGCRSVYTLEFEAQNQGFSRFLARLALLIGAADIEDVVEIERQLQRYLHARARRAMNGVNEAPSKLKRSADKVSDHADPQLPRETVFAQPGALHGAVDTAYLPGQQLKILLEPLLPNGAPAGTFGDRRYGVSTPSIQITIPPNFRAHFGPGQALSQPVAHTRRLRGTSYPEHNEPEPALSRKPGSAGTLINSADHCRAAAAFMADRQELQWLRERVFFLQQRE